MGSAALGSTALSGLTLGQVAAAAALVAGMGAAAGGAIGAYAAFAPH